MQLRKHLRPKVTILVIALLLSTLVSAHLQAQTGSADDDISMGLFFAHWGVPHMQQLVELRQQWRMDQDTNTVKNLSVLATFNLNEADFLISLNKLMVLPSGDRNLEGLHAVMLQLYGRLVDEMYQHEADEVASSNVPYYTRQSVRDLILASALLENFNAPAPLLDCLMRRATDFSVFDTTSGFLATARDVLDPEFPNVHGASNLIAAIYTNADIGKLHDGSPERQLCLEACKQSAEAAVAYLSSDYCSAIAHFLLAKRLANDQKDLAWDYFLKSIDLSSDSSDVKALSLAPFFHKDVYVQAAVAFTSTYFKYLFEDRRYLEIATCAKRLLGCKSGDNKFQQRICQRSIDWLKKSMRVLYDEERFQLYNQLDGELQYFQELYNPVTNVIVDE